MDGHDVDGLAVVVHLAHGAEDFLMGGDEEVLLAEGDGGVVDDFGGLRHHTAEDGLFGFGAIKNGGREDVLRGEGAALGLRGG